jgi:hypothetical protein
MNVGRLNTQARIITKTAIEGDDTTRDEAIDAVRDQARDWAYKTLVGTRVEIAEFDVED